MSTTVVHVNDPGGFDIYIGRAVRRAKDPRCHIDSPWCNPFPVDDFPTRQACLAEYERYIRSCIAIAEDPDTEEPAHAEADLLAMEGKRLGCWCKDAKGRRDRDLPCHGDVLVRLIEEARR